MSHFQIAIGDIVVADDRQTVRPDGQGRVLADVTGCIEGCKCGGGTGDIGAMGDFQIPIRHIVVADDTQVVSPDYDGRVLADIAFALKNRARRGHTHHLFTVDNFEIAVRRIVIADEGPTIRRANRHGAVLAHIGGFIGSRREGRFRAGQILAEGGLQVVIRGVIIADDALTHHYRDRRVEADVSLGLQECEGGNRRDLTRDVVAMSRFQVPVRDIVVGDEGQFVSADGQRGVLADIPSVIERCERGGGAGEIGTMRDFQIPIRRVVVRDEPSVVASERDRGVLANVAGAVQGTDGRGAAGLIRAVRDFQIPIRRIVVADKSQTISPNGNGAVPAGITGTIASNERESWALQSRIIRAGALAQLQAGQQRKDGTENNQPSHRSLAGADLHETPVSLV